MSAWLPLPFLEHPSLVSGVACGPDESGAPDQWQGLLGVWAPFLGVQGSVLYDLSPGANHGTPTNFTLATAWGAVGPWMALQFDGASTYVDIPKAVLTAAPMTLMGWFYTGSTTGVQPILTIQGSANNQQMFRLILYQSKVQAQIQAMTSQILLATAANYPLSTWAHAACVFTGSGQLTAVYLNGALGNSSTASWTAPTAGTLAVTYVGRTFNVTEVMNGSLNDLRIYNRVLSGAEIMAVYQGTVALYRPRPRWWLIPGTTVQVARPSADTTRDNWEEDDGTTTDIFDQIDETSADDADYIRTVLTPTNDVYVTKLTSLTDPNVHTGHVLRYRYRKDNANGEQINLTVQLRQGYTNESSQGTLIKETAHTNISGSAWTAGTMNLSEAEAANISDYTSLYVRLVGNAP